MSPPRHLIYTVYGLFYGLQSSILSGLFMLLLTVHPHAKACSWGALDGIEVGDKLERLLGTNGKLASCGGEATVTYYSGDLGSGYVFCSPASRDSGGRRVLLINHEVKAIMIGPGTAGYCSWGNAVGGD